MFARRPRHEPPPSAGSPADHIDLEHYAPAYINWISNKLSRGASQQYLEQFGVGIEVWRLLMEVATRGQTSAQEAVKALGMNKASVSRALKGMLEQGLVHLALDESDGRVRQVSLTPKGRTLHARIEQLALVREREFLSVLEPHERQQLIQMLRRLHDHLPEVEARARRFALGAETAATRKNRRTA